MDEGGRRKLDEILQRFTVQGKGRAIFNQGEPAHCYILCGGTVKLTHVYPGGEEIVFDVLIAPAVFGRRERGRPSLQPYSVVSLSSAVEIAHFNIEKLLSLLKDYPAAMFDLVNHLRKQTEKAYNLLACMRFPVRERLISIIALTLALGDSTFVTVPFSNIELAQMAQTAPETISRTLQQLRAEGLVKSDPKGAMTIKTSVLREQLQRSLNSGSH
jgi:CRP-like cAMP-binding protein